MGNLCRISKRALQGLTQMGQKKPAWIRRLKTERELVIEDENARLGFLRRWADVVVGRPHPGIRRGFWGLPKRKHFGCWACGRRHDITHHIVQVQHGGTNSLTNLCRLCHACHQVVHPWLATPEIPRHIREMNAAIIED